MIRVVDVTHHYGVKPVLRQINLEIPRGQVIALMGPNGMGKSTLVSVMAGVHWPIKGFVEINGQRRRSSPLAETEIRKQVVYLPADPWLQRSATGRQWLLAIGDLYGIETDRLMEHIERLLGLFNLEIQADWPISLYSTGQKKKIALAGALVSEAPVMLLDEPFAGGLDPSGILALRRVLQHLAKRDDVTIVMATPVPELVEELADRIAIIRDGQIIADGTLDALRQSSGLPGAALADVYQKLVSPQQADKIEEYFQATG